MPSTIHVTREQLAVLAERDADITLLELPRAEGEIEAWVDREHEQARSLILAPDGEIISDMATEDAT